MSAANYNTISVEAWKFLTALILLKIAISGILNNEFKLIRCARTDGNVTYLDK